MREISIRLTSPTDVKEFVSAASNVECDVEVIDGERAVNARSINDMFDLDFKRPLQVAIIGAKEAVESFCRSVERMIVL